MPTTVATVLSVNVGRAREFEYNGRPAKSAIPFFIPPGAKAYRRDNPDAVVEFLDTGHFALKTHVNESARAIDRLLSRVSRSSHGELVAIQNG